MSKNNSFENYDVHLFICMNTRGEEAKYEIKKK